MGGNFKSVAAGIDTVGNQEVEVKDLGGFSHIVKFDYAKSVQIFVNISIQVDSKFEKRTRRNKSYSK